MQPGTSTTAYNPLYDPATDNLPIAADVQARINTPQVDPTGFDPADEAFIYDIVNKFDEGVIKRYEPSSLLHADAYEKLQDLQKGKADLNALNILTIVRGIYDQWKANPVPTFQIETQIRQIRLMKERVETELGDIYVI